MTAQILRLHAARQITRSRSFDHLDEGNIEPSDVDALDLCELALVIRNRFTLPCGLDDAALIQSLREIQNAHGDRERWLAAFNSTLGLYLSLRAKDFNKALQDLLAIVPAPRS